MSELARPRPDASVVRWASEISVLTLSVVSLEEICFGLAWRPNARVQTWFDRFFAERCRVLPVDAAIARRGGLLRGGLASRGRPRTQADALVAATALEHDLTLVTRNERDFAEWGVRVLNPFS